MFTYKIKKYLKQIKLKKLNWKIRLYTCNKKQKQKSKV